MLCLSRTVRFCLPADASAFDQPRSNTFACWPPPTGLDPYLELTVTCEGEADEATGYFINIKDIDAAVRSHVLPLLHAHRCGKTSDPLPRLLGRCVAALQPDLNHTVTQLALALTPRTTMSITPTPHADAEQRKASGNATVYLSQQYEFSAAHRLHVAEYDDDRNRAIFGKCNNPEGHGHNYRVEVVARCPVDDAGQTLAFGELDAAVDEHVIEVLDHKHLNRDVPQFASLNPSVENIVKVVWQLLDGNLPGNAELGEVTVWETGKTACTYRGA